MITTKTNGGEVLIGEYGLIRLEEHMGGDLSIVRAARVSYGDQPDTHTEQENRALIRYLMRHDHGTPFEMIQFVFYVKCPIFVARQWMRHRICSYNEISYRYVEPKYEFYVPEKEDINPTSSSKKQGRAESKTFPDSDASNIRNDITDAYTAAEGNYHFLDSYGVARETARIVLPLGIYTEFYWSINLRSLFNFLKLRTDKHAQKEIRVYAKSILLLVREHCPVAIEAFEDYTLNGARFSAQELDVIRNVAFTKDVEGMAETKMSKSEVVEFMEKLR